MNGLLILIERLMTKVIQLEIYILQDFIIDLGFEYCVNQTLSSWCPVEKLFHLNRRRRWYRTRVLRNDQTIEEKKVFFSIFH